MSKYLVAKKFFEKKRPTGGLYDAEIEYLENSSFQYINTHIIPTDNTKFELTFKAEEHSSTWSVFFGSTTSDDSPNSVLFRFYGDDDLFNIWFGQADYTIPTFDCIYSEKCTITLEYGKCTLNNDEYEIESEPLFEPYEIYLFGGNYPNDSSKPWRPQYFKCYGFKVYESNTLIMDLIPVRKGNVGYMYDKVSGQLFENQGSGNFILGQDTAYPEIEEPEEPEETPSAKFIVGKHYSENIFQNNQFSVIKKQFKTKINLEFDSQGGTSHEQKEVILGETYGELPVPTKSQNIFIGWFTDPTSGQQITKDSIVELNITKLYARWEYVQIDSDCTSYSVTTTSSYRNTGIYTASISNSSQPIYIDWGDGTVEKTNSSISQKSHTYKTNGNFTVKISNNITSFAPSYNNSTWYGTTSQNRYTFNKMISTGSNINSLPSYAFYYCQKMTNIDFMETCFTNVTSLPSYCFYYCSGLTSIQGAARYTSLGAYCFQYCTGLTGIQDLSEFKFTTLPNSYTFANCTNVTQWILPSGFNGTSFGSYMFANNSSLIGVGNIEKTINQIKAVQIDYLESTQMEQWFDTGIYFTNNKVEITCALKTPYTNTEFIWWGTNTYSSYNPNIWTFTNKISMGDLTKWMDYASNELSLNTKYTITYDVPSKSLYLNGEKIQSIGGDFSTYKSRNTIKIGKRDGDVIVGFGILYAFKIWKDDILIQDLIPVRIGNVGYMYDRVSGKLFENQGIGSFILGPDKTDAEEIIIEQETLTSKLPESLTSTGTYIFQNCSNLNNIIIPSKVQSIGNYAFYGCTSLNNVSIEATNLTVINQYAFYNCSKLTNLDLPDTVKTIGNYAFYGCTSLDYVGKQNKEIPSQLTSIGSYAYQGCSNLKSLNIPENLQTIGDYAFAGCRNLSSISDYRLTAQTVGANTFGNTTGTGSSAYTGYSTKGNNKLSVYVAATGYDESYWNDPLQNPDKGGFQLAYLDPENIKYCNITLNAGDGSVSESTLQVIQGKKIGTLPTPTCPAETPYFGGWYTGQDGTGEKYKADSLAPNQDTLTLYAYYGTTPFASYTVDLNGQWVKSTSQSNPDDGQYDGVYESNSNYNVNSGWAKMYIRISGYTQFTIYIRSYAESSYDYVVAMNLDVDVTSNPSSSTSGVKAHTSGKQNSSQAIGGYTKVEYTDIDGGEHFICVVYRKDSSVNSGNDRGYVLIEQPANPITITFDIGNGELTSGDLTAIGYQGRPMGNITPKVQGNSGSPYFVEWNTMPDGSGNAYSSDTMLPISSTLTLYAIYSDQFPYTFIEYIESRNSFIDTKHNVTVNTQMEFEIKLIEDAPTQLIGASYLNMSDSNDYRFFYTYEQAYFDYGNKRIATKYTMDKSSWYYVKCVNGSVTINDNIFTGSTTTTVPTNETIKIFGCSEEYVDMRLKYLKIYENNVLIQDLVPVRKGNVGYMYDMVSGRIFENTGTGSFVLGPDKSTEPIEDLLCFEAAEANSTISMQAVGDAPVVSLKTTTDGILWRDFIVGQTTVCLADVGDKIYFRAKQDNNTFATSSSNYNKFVMTGKIAASGNLNTLLKDDGSIIDLTGRDYCYSRMFYGCTSLTQVPSILPATTLANNCYQSMFNGCSSLTQAPELPATTLANNCYNRMFYDCSSLTQAPAILPAETLANNCYYMMFQNCTSLTKAPELPATTLAESCYYNMFRDCTSLTQVPSILPATTLAESCYYNMFRDCTALTQAPELPATTLANKCYYNMFYGCTSLTQAPILPATTLVAACYYSMFSGCTKLNSINVNFSAWNISNATISWVKNVSPTGTFKCPSILPETYGISYIPGGWNIEKKITTASEYVQDGLIAMWDGIENAGWNTHDENATVWKDLIGNNDLLIGSDLTKAYFKEDSMHRNDTLGDLVTSEFINYPCTIQMLVDMQYTDESRNERFFSHSDKTSTSNRREFDCYSQNKVSAPRAYPNARYGSFNRNTNGFWDITVKYPDSTNFTFIDSICNKSYSNVLLEMSSPLKINIGAWFDTHSSCNGDYYNIRIYNRILTEEEIQHNYRIDQLRFGSST